MMVSFVLSFFPRDVLDEILNLIESVSEDFPSYSYPTYLDRAVGKSNTGLDQQADGSHCWRLDFVLLKTISTVFRNCNHCIVVDD